MAFQSTVKYDYGFGIVGEIVRGSPFRAHTGYLNSASAANNVFGRFFTLKADGQTIQAGGTGAPWGFLSNPKQHASFGGAQGPLSPSLALPNNVVADFVEFGKIVCALGGAKAATIGAQLQYVQADGTLSIPATPGTPDANCTLLQAWIEDFPQPQEANNLILVRVNY